MPDHTLDIEIDRKMVREAEQIGQSKRRHGAVACEQAACRRQRPQSRCRLPSARRSRPGSGRDRLRRRPWRSCRLGDQQMHQPAMPFSMAARSRPLRPMMTIGAGAGVRVRPPGPGRNSGRDAGRRLGWARRKGLSGTSRKRFDPLGCRARDSRGDAVDQRVGDARPYPASARSSRNHRDRVRLRRSHGRAGWRDRLRRCTQAQEALADRRRRSATTAAWRRGRNLRRDIAP